MLLSSADHARIREATKAAEATTSGEIVCIVAEEASSYCEVPLAWAAVAALVFPVIVLSLGGAAWLDAELRGWSAAHLAAAHSTILAVLGGYVLLQGMLFVVVALIGSIPGVRRILTPGGLRRGAVHRRAIEQFHAHDLSNTRERTGVLIYASMKDRVAEVIADTGIDAKVGAEAWRGVIGVLTTGIKSGRAGDGFVAAIDAAGRLLALHFPPPETNTDELPDELVELPVR